jgi:hypothetical protein
MECDGSGEVEMYHDYEGVDWLDWFDGNRMRMYDRIMDAIIMYVDSVETSKDNG